MSDRPTGGRAEAPFAAVVLAAGKGTRMRSDRPKVLHSLAGRPMICQLLDTVAAIGPARVVVVVGGGRDDVAASVAPHETVVQERQLGTGHAVLQARTALDGFSGEVLVVYGDTPLLRADTLRALLAARRGEAAPAIVVLGFRPADPTGYGRLLVGGDGLLEAIVEDADASVEQRAIGLCNSGVMAVEGGLLFSLLDRLRADNAQKEYYLTDIVGLARASGRACAVVEAAAEELLGIDSRADLARAETVVQARLRARAMAEGATLIDPATTWLSFDTRLGRDVVVGPNVCFGPAVEIGDRAEILPFCHLEGVRVAPGARIGPFARLRPGAEIGAAARVGNFVEIKAATVEAGAKVNHLAYIGDARVGAGANIGAGTITCNYDGFAKHRTEIGDGAFIGSNAALVAPVSIGARAVIGAGSVITGDVDADALALARGRQRNVPGAAARLRERRSGKG